MSHRHQSHKVHNRNLFLRQAPIKVQNVGETILDPTDGRLKVIPERHFEFKVPFQLGEGKHSFHDAPNPVNQLGPLVEGHVPVACSNDFMSFMASFNKRSNFVQKDALDDIDTDSFNRSIAIINALPDSFPHWDDNDVDRERWLSKFDQSKRKRMLDAHNHFTTTTYKHIGTKDLSVKQEILLKRYDDEWAPRVIYAGNDVFNSITGPPAMVAMERFVKLCSNTAIGNVSFKPAYKTTDVQLLEFLIDEKYTHTVEGDFSRNDREQRSKVALIYDAWLRKLNMPQWFRTLNLKLENYTVQNRQYGFKAKLKYQLPTGTTNTTIRNSVYNATMFAVVCQRQKRFGKALILGDDLLARLNQRLDIKAWVTQVARFRMVLKGKAPILNGAATFLSRRIILNTPTPCMLPLIGKMLARFNARGTMNPSCSDDSYMAGKALSYAYECRHVPFLRKFFLQRFNKYADATPDFSDLSWFTRTSGYDSLDKIVAAIDSEQVLVNDDEFCDWLLTFYDSDLYELGELCNNIIVNDNPTLVNQAWFERFTVDI